MPSLHLLLRVVREPRRPIDKIVDATRMVLAAAKLDVKTDVPQKIDDDHAKLLDIHVSGDCDGPGELSANQVHLFATTKSQPNEIVIFFVRSTVGGLSGCAQHPDRQPGAVITADCSLFTLAHELGHLLGLQHVDDDTTRLMHTCTLDITVRRPVLDSSEITTMLKSGLIHHP